MIRLSTSEARRLGLKAKGRSKYRNTIIKTVSWGTFHSKREYERFLALMLMEQRGEISCLGRQKEFILEVRGVQVGIYKCDFHYCDKGYAAQWIIEDVKPKFKTEKSRKKYERGAAWQLFALKKRIMEAMGYTVRIV